METLQFKDNACGWKGKSKYSITVLVKPEDVDNWGLPKELIGKKITKPPQYFSKITGISPTTMVCRLLADEKSKNKRGTRQVVGFDPFDRRINEKGRNQKKPDRKKLINKMLRSW